MSLTLGYVQSKIEHCGRVAIRYDNLAGKLYSVTHAAVLSSPRQKEKARRNGFDRPAPLDLHFNVVSNHTHVVGASVLIGWRTENFSCAHIKLCAVPRAGDLVTLDFSFGQRPFLMRAGIFEGKERPLDVEERYLLALMFHEPRRARRDLARFSHLHKFSHALILHSDYGGHHGA